MRPLVTVGEPETEAFPRAEPMVRIHLPPAERVHETSVPAGLIPLGAGQAEDTAGLFEIAP